MINSETRDGELNVGGSVNLRAIVIDILDPVMMVCEAISGDADDLHVALFEVLSATSDLTEFGRADRGEISGMGEQDCLKYV